MNTYDSFRKTPRARLAGRPSMGWVWRRAQADTRSAALLFLFLFLLAMPAVLLVIGREGYALIGDVFNLSIPDCFPYIAHVGSLLQLCHFFIALLSFAAVLTLCSLQFRFLCRTSSVDAVLSAPFTRLQQLFGRLAAVCTGILFIYAVNGLITAIIFSVWRMPSALIQYLPLYLVTFLATLVFAGFTTLIQTLAGRMFDALLLNLAFQAAWGVSFFVMIAGKSYPQLKEILFSLLPAAEVVRVAFAPVHVWIRLLCFMALWTGLAAAVFCRRPAENAGMRIGRFRWHGAVQPLFSMFFGILLGLFLEILFTLNSHMPRRSAAFYCGLVIGAFLGQLASSSVSGKPLRHAKAGGRMPWFLKEWLLSLAGIACYFILIAVTAPYVIQK